MSFVLYIKFPIIPRCTNKIILIYKILSYHSNSVRADDSVLLFKVAEQWYMPRLAVEYNWILD